WFFGSSPNSTARPRPSVRVTGASGRRDPATPGAPAPARLPRGPKASRPRFPRSAAARPVVKVSHSGPLAGDRIQFRLIPEVPMPKTAVIFLALVLGCAAGVSRLAGSESPDARLKGAARRAPLNGWTYVRLEGTPAEIGFQNGYLLAPEI